MNRWDIQKLCQESEVVNKVEYIQQVCKGKTVLDLGCIRHSQKFSIDDPNWLHRKITDVATKVIGFDYLKKEVRKFEETRYDIRYGDITTMLPISEKFDVIVAGDVIEHLTNFNGFFENCQRLIKDDGILVITTPNPFYTDTFHSSAFKGTVPVNPEHTCWFDPQTLMQLADRFEFEVVGIHYLKESWKLSDTILENESFYYDPLQDTWNDNSPISEMKRHGFGLLFKLIYRPFKTLTYTNTKTTAYADYLTILRFGGYKSQGGLLG